MNICMCIIHKPLSFTISACGKFEKQNALDQKLPNEFFKIIKNVFISLFYTEFLFVKNLYVSDFVSKSSLFMYKRKKKQTK